MLIVNGNLTIDTPPKFNSTDKSIAILVRNNLTFTGVVQEAAGIFVANRIDTGVAADQGLKVRGNFISQLPMINGRTWAASQKPSLFIIQDPRYNIELLDLLSTSKYEYKQLQ